MTPQDDQTAAVYIRVSTEEQTEYSPDSQLKEIQAYAANHGIFISPTHIYVDEGISGRKSRNRPAFQRMLSAARQQPPPFHIVLVYKFSRFARNREDSIVCKNLLRKKCGISVRSVTEPLDDDNKISIVMESVIEAMDEYYSLNLSEDVRRTMLEKHLRGEPQCAPPYGYRMEGKRLLPDEPTANIVREIFHRFAAGEGYYAIARSLNENGITTRQGKPFENRTVEYILRNPVYMGSLRWNPVQKTQRHYDAPDIIFTQGTHSPLVDETTWHRAQQRVLNIKQQSAPWQKPPVVKASWVSGLIRCADCGKTLVRTSAACYVCNGYQRASCRCSDRLRTADIEQILLQKLRYDLSPTKEVSFCRTPQNTKPADIVLRDKQHKLQKKLERLREAYLNGTESLTDYSACKQKLEQEIQQLAEQADANAKGPTADVLTDEELMNASASLQGASCTTVPMWHAVTSVVEGCRYRAESKTVLLYYRLFLPSPERNCHMVDRMESFLPRCDTSTNATPCLTTN